MQKMKRFLSIVLVVCMLISVLPASALAIDITIHDKPANGTTQGQPFAPGTADSEKFRIPGIITLSNGTLVASCDARWNDKWDSAGLDTIVSVSTDNGANWEYTFANYLGDNGNVRDTNSSCIIDPAIATDGTTIYLIADLFPAGFATNSAKYTAQSGSTGFDEAGNLLLRSDEENSIEFGMNGYGAAAAAATYGYYLKNGSIYQINAEGEDAVVEGYTVDAYFNITGNDISTNLFYADSPYKPFPHDYLYMTTSTDGLDWSEPTLLNLKKTTESALLVGPGNGTYDASTGNMVFTAYRHGGGADEYACLIWKDTEDAWHRTENATVNGWSSEATTVALGDGRMRVFYREDNGSLRYTDYVWSEEQNDYLRDANATEVATSARKTTRNQLTSLMYSKKIDGKDVLLVANANGGGSSRTNGYLSVFLVNEDNSMELVYSYDIFPGQNEYYAYNCITEMNDGNIALLYENGEAAINFHVIDMEEVLDRENDLRLTVKKAELVVGGTVTFTDNTGDYANADTTELNEEVATVDMAGETITSYAAKVLGSGATIALDSCQYTFKEIGTNTYEVFADAGGTTVYLNHYNSGTNQIPNVTDIPGKIVITKNTNDNMFKLLAKVQEGGTGGDRTLHFHTEQAEEPYWNRCGNASHQDCREYLYRKAANGETASEEIPGYIRITSQDEIKPNGKYLIAAQNTAEKWYVMNPSTSGDQLNHVAQVLDTETTVGNTEITFTGEGPGETEVVIGSVLYKLSVYNVENVTVNVPLGQTVTVVEPNGNYSGTDTSTLDENIATVKMTGEDATAANGLSLKPVTELTGGSYVIVNQRAKKILTSTPYNNNNEGLLFRDGKDVNPIPADAVWTISGSNGAYTVQDQNKQFLSVTAGDADVGSESKTLLLEYNGGGWSIGMDTNGNKQYLNHYGGSSSTQAAGHHSVDDGSKFDIYTYSETPVEASSTTLTFTGVKAGTTELLVGRTKFIITVTDHCEEINLVPGETYESIVSGNYADVTGNEIVGVQAVYAPFEIKEGVYYLQNARIKKYLESTSQNDMLWCYAAAAGTNGTAEPWTIKKDGNGYTVQNHENKYLTFDASTSKVTDTKTVLNFIWKDTTWQIGLVDANGTMQYLNIRMDGAGENKVAGWHNDGDIGSQWNLYDANIEPVYSAGTYYTVGDLVNEDDVHNTVNGKYYLTNKRADTSLTNIVRDVSDSNGRGKGLTSRLKSEVINHENYWVINQVGDRYTVQDCNGDYLTVGVNENGIGSNSWARMMEVESYVDLTFVPNGDNGQNYWTITNTAVNANGDNKLYFLNDYNGGFASYAPGNQTHQSAGPGNIWFMYTVENETVIEGTTTVTFTAGAEGKTEMVIGDTLYRFVVCSHSDTTTAGAVKPTLCEFGHTGTTTCDVCGKTLSEDAEITKIPYASVLKNDKPIALSDCEYYYDGTSFVHTAANGTTKYYVQPRGAASTDDIDGAGKWDQLPQATQKYYDIEIVWNNVDNQRTTDENAVWIRSASSNSSGNGTGSIHVWTNREKPFWDACGGGHGYNSGDGTHDVYLFRATGNTVNTPFPGYEMVTEPVENSELAPIGNYLIAARKTANDVDTWYVMVPTGETTSYSHIAQYMGEKDITGHTAAAAVRENEVLPTLNSTGSYDEVVYCSVCGAEISRETVTVDALTVKNLHPFMDGWRTQGTVVALTDALYTLSGTANGSYSLCGNGAYYVNPSIAGTPQQREPFAGLTLSFQQNGAVRITGGGKTLQVNNTNQAATNTNHPWWHNFSNQTNYTTDFYLLKAKADSTNTNIPGYEIVTEVAEGESYLIAFKNGANEWFVMYPSTKTVSLAMVVDTAINHPHEYSDATCTAPATCSCGTVQGTALPHTPGAPIYAKTVTGYTKTVSCSVCRTVMSTENVDKFGISYANIAMENSLEVCFAFGMYLMDAEEWEDCYAVIEHKYAGGSKTDTQKVEFDDWKRRTINKDNYYSVTFKGVAAKEMADKFQVTIYKADGTAISETYTDSIEEYALRTLRGNGSEAYKRVVVDLLNYGAEAQKAFKYNTGNLANRELSEEQKQIGNVGFDGYLNKDNCPVDYKANVKLESKLQFLMAFTGINDKMSAEVTFTDWNSKERTITIDGEKFVDAGTFHYFTIEDLVVADGRQVITCTIYDANGKQVAQVTDSLASYAGRTTTNPELYKAIVKFSDSAKAYLQNK